MSKEIVIPEYVFEVSYGVVWQQWKDFVENCKESDEVETENE